MKRNGSLLLLTAFVTSSCITESKYVKLYNKEEICIDFAVSDISAKHIQESIDQAKRLDESVQNVLTTSFEKSETDVRELAIKNDLIKITKTIPAQPTTNKTDEKLNVLIVDKNIKIADLFDQCLRTHDRPTFFATYSSTISDLLQSKQNRKKDKQQITALVASLIDIHSNALGLTDYDALVQILYAPYDQAYPYQTLQQLLKNSLRAASYNKELAKLYTKAEIASLQKKLKLAHKTLEQNDSYKYEKSIKNQTFITNQMPYRYNQLPYIDRNFIKQTTTETGAPMCKTYHQLQYK